MQQRHADAHLHGPGTFGRRSFLYRRVTASMQHGCLPRDADRFRFQYCGQSPNGSEFDGEYNRNHSFDFFFGIQWQPQPQWGHGAVGRRIRICAGCRSSCGRCCICSRARVRQYVTTKNQSTPACGRFSVQRACNVCRSSHARAQARSKRSPAASTCVPQHLAARSPLFPFTAFFLHVLTKSLGTRCRVRGKPRLSSEPLPSFTHCVHCS